LKGMNIKQRSKKNALVGGRFSFLLKEII